MSVLKSAVIPLPFPTALGIPVARRSPVPLITLVPNRRGHGGIGGGNYRAGYGQYNRSISIDGLGSAHRNDDPGNRAVAPEMAVPELVGLLPVRRVNDGRAG